MNIFTIIGVVVVVIWVAGYFGVDGFIFDLANPVQSPVPLGRIAAYRSISVTRDGSR